MPLSLFPMALSPLMRSTFAQSVSVILKPILPPARFLRPLAQAAIISGLMVGASSIGSRALAAESVTLQWGRLSQTINLGDLDTFVATGEIPPALGRYRPVLTPSLREALQSQIILEPQVSQIMLAEVLQTPGGSQLLDTLKAVAPNLSANDLRITVNRASLATDGLNLLSILRALPPETLELDVGTLLSLAAQFRLAQLESEALSQVLSQSLAVPTATTVTPGGLALFVDGPAEVERWELVLLDRNRDRSIPVDIYWSEATHGPLVVLSHGFGADRRFFAYLAHHLASHGLTVVSVEHPGSNVAALTAVPSPNQQADPPPNRILPATEFLDRPKDISFVLDRMEKLNLYSYSLRDRINTQQVTLIGHSLGGSTGLALAGAPFDLKPLESFCRQLNPVNFSPADWLQCAALDLPIKQANLKDDRITQLILTNPLTGRLFGDAGLSQVKVPTLMLASTHDGVTPMAKQQLGPFTQLGGPKYLITVLGGSHLSVGDPDNLNAELRYIPFMPALPNATTASLRNYLQGISLGFIMQQTPEAAAYAAALSPDYAEYFSTPDLPLRLSQDLPQELLGWPRLQAKAFYSQDDLLTYVPSLLHLEAMAIQDQFQLLQRQMVAYLRTSPPSLTALYWPRQLLQPQVQAHKPEKDRASP